MFQYQIYPSGNISNYVTKVNNVSGVSAIMDRRMGITEHSMSGVAYYIKAICDYINQNNTGTSVLPIVSGYFNHIGFTSYEHIDGTQYPFVTSADGIISGVSEIYSSGVVIHDSTPDVDSIIANSGTFYNSFFDRGFSRSSINIKDFSFTGTLKNIYSGYYLAEDPLSLVQPVINQATDYPFDLGMNAVLVGMSIRERINSTNKEFGFIRAMLSATSLTVNNLTGVNVSGNFYINGSYKPNLDEYDSSPSVFCESLFQMTSHNHDGINSATLDFSKFNASHPVETHFSLVLSSGNLTIGQDYTGNGIGLGSNWERVDIPDVDNIQKLFACKDKLYALDNQKIVEINSFPVRTLSMQRWGEFPRAQVIATSKGDSPALIEFNKSRDYYLGNLDDIDNVTSMVITPFNSNQPTELYFTYTGLSDAFTNATSRKEIFTDPGVRLGSKLYFTLLEKYSSTTNDVLTLYEVNTLDQPMSLKAVAHYELQGSNNWRFAKPIKYKNSLHYFMYSSGNERVCAVYNTIYKPQQFVREYLLRTYDNVISNVFIPYQMEYSVGARYGFNIFDTTTMTYTETTGLSKYTQSSSAVRDPIDYTYFMGRPNVTGMNCGFVFSTINRNRMAIFPNIGTSTCNVSYAGKLWTGSALHIGRDAINRDVAIPAYLNQLRTLTGLSTPWLMSPVVYHGWLYAIAPTQSYSEWTATTFASLEVIDERLPAGSMVVRRRASETDLVRMHAYSL